MKLQQPPRGARVGTRSTPKRRSRRWLVYLIVGLAGPAALLSGVLAYYYVTFSRLIDSRLHGERDRVWPRVFARPFGVYVGQTLTQAQLIDRLNELSYVHRDRVAGPGTFAIGRESIATLLRSEAGTGRPARIAFRRGRVAGIELPPGTSQHSLTFEAPLLTALSSASREKRRRVQLSAIPPRVIRAVLAIEDRRFYDHPGVDAIGTFRALLTNIRGDRPYLVGGSTLTQQLVKNFFLTKDKSYGRKLLEQFMALILERRASKDEILELYLNDVYLGQRGSFSIHGVGEAARLFFGKDVSNLSLSEAATIAGVIQNPPALSPFRWPDRSRERRNLVLQAMVTARFIPQEDATRAAREPLVVVRRALESEAPYFVDAVSKVIAEEFPVLSQSGGALDIHTTLDMHLQRVAEDAVREGLEGVDKILSRKRRPRHPQAALIALDPRTGEVLALVGGRSYNQTQFNRAIHAKRQPGSVFKPFVYLAAFEAAADGSANLTPATLVVDEPTTFEYHQQVWNPTNYQDEYDGLITLRRALALSRNVATIKVAEVAGYEKVAAVWKRVGTSTPPRPYPSIALGVFEATPMEVASAYSIFPNLGAQRQAWMISRITNGRSDLVRVARPPSRTVARSETAYLVTNMMRSVINEGTGAGARGAGFVHDAAGKSGTTNDLRDAWFVGFTPELLTVVWVGLDDNTPLGLSGTQAALPIWSKFMIRALAGKPNQRFVAPPGITFIDIDRDTGMLATPLCPRIFNEAFLSGSEPTTVCDEHR